MLFQTGCILSIKKNDNFPSEMKYCYFHIPNFLISHYISLSNVTSFLTSYQFSYQFPLQNNLYHAVKRGFISLPNWSLTEVRNFHVTALLITHQSNNPTTQFYRSITGMPNQ